MAESDRLARAHYRQQQALSRRLARVLADMWGLVDPDDLDGSWLAIIDRVAQAVALAQYQAALASVEYVAAQTAAQDAASGPDGVVDPRAFAGVAADGRPLASLLTVGVVTTKARIGAGMSLPDAMRSGLASLLLAGTNEQQQAGRNADQVGITGQPAFEGYVRTLTPPSCPRCMILAGKVFHWNAGFARHPHCDCVHRPIRELSRVGDAAINPRKAFDAMSAAEQDRYFGKANAQAIRDGADMSQVVNIYAKRTRRTEIIGADGKPTRYAPNSGLFEYDVMGRRLQYTKEGANVSRGRYGKAMGEATGQTDQFQRRQRGLDPTVDRFELSDVKRLTPRSIYDLAGDDRALALDLLRRYGYVL